VLLPFLVVAALLVARRAGSGRTPWIAIVVFALVLPLSAWASIATGEQQEDIVENVVAEGAIHGHEEAAEGFLAGSAVLAVIVLAGLLPGRAGRAARWTSVAASVVVVALAVRVGGSGGKLVYEQGAAAAYVTQGEGTRVALPADRKPRDHDDEDEVGGDR